MPENLGWKYIYPRGGGTSGSGNIRHGQMSIHGGTTTTPSQTYRDDYGQQQQPSSNTGIPASAQQAFAQNALRVLQNNQGQPMSPSSSSTGRSQPTQADVGNHQSSNQQDCVQLQLQSPTARNCSRCGKAIPDGQWCDCPYGRQQESHAEIRTTVQCAKGCGRLRVPWVPYCQPCQDKQRKYSSQVSCVRGLELGWAVGSKR